MDVRSIMSGQRKDPLALLLCGATRMAAPFYGLATRYRNRRFDRGSAEIHRAGAPVISVGNITTGGTGKTPTVAWIARHLRQQGVRVSIVSRGFRADETGVNDEALELEQRLPDVPHIQNPDRVEAARVATEELDTQLIVMDDGFQHRRLHRDLDIVLIDATCPFGYDHLLPRGLLREPLSGLSRADVILLTRASMANESERQRIQERIRQFNDDALWVECDHKPSHLQHHGKEDRPLTELKDKNVLAISAIGNPSAFLETLRDLGSNVIAGREFPDHHHYDREDLVAIREWITEHPKAECVLCTQKDLVKLQTSQIAGVPLYAVCIEMKIASGRDHFTALIDAVAQ